MRVTTLLFFFIITLTTVILIPTEANAQLIISEFRVRGPNGANDEFIEIYNNSGADHTVAGGGTGYGVAASNGTARCVIPNGTVIPNRGHYLCVNSVGYSLASYPAGNGTTATGDATYTTDIPDNAGIAIFNTSVAANFVLANRLDAVGSTSEANTLYKEGTGYPALTPFSIDYSFYRDLCGKGGSITTFGHCALNGPKDTNNNAADFVFVDTNGTSAGAGQRLGAPGPENLSSPIPSGANVIVNPPIKITPFDPCVQNFSPPNSVRDFTSDSANNSTFGTVDLRFRLTNLTGGSMTRLRFRVVDLTTFPAPSGIADLRPRTSTSIVVTQDAPPCGSGTSNVSVNGTTLEQPPSQPNGGGFNSTLSVGNVTLGTPVPHGANIPFRILLGVQQNGSFKIGIIVETLPGGGAVHYVQGVTNSLAPFDFAEPFDFTGDDKADVSVYRASSGQWWYRNSTSGAVTGATFGNSTDIPVPADYTGDGLVDRAFFRPSTGQWFILRSDNGSFYSAPFGISTDLPAPGDFDGDGLADLAVFRPSNGTWYIDYASGGNKQIVWGQSGDLPVNADFDGDDRSDIAIWRPSVGQWWILYSTGGYVAYNFGSSTDKAVVGDYTGDRRADVAFWRPSTGQWFILRSQDQSYYSAPFGAPTDLPVPGDYDGDGKFDVAVFRPSGGTWYINNTGGVPANTTLNFGFGTDDPLPNSYVR
jgi:hypothetical protein